MIEEEVKMLDWQNATAFMFIGTLVVSIILTYDFKQRLLKKPRLFNDQEAYTINLTNRIIFAILVLIIVYLDYKAYCAGKIVGRNTAPLTHQLEASVLKLVAAIITIYVLLEDPEMYNLADVENPGF